MAGGELQTVVEGTHFAEICGWTSRNISATRFCKHRELVRLSQRALADRARLDRTSPSGIERGRRNPTLNAPAKVIHGFGGRSRRNLCDSP